MSIFLWVAIARAFKKYVVYATPEQIAALIKQWYPNTTYSGNKIKVRSDFWNTRNFIIHSGPMPTVLESSWAMSKAMWVIIILSLIIVPIGIILATIHLWSNVSFAEEIIFKLNASYPPMQPYGQPAIRHPTNRYRAV